MTTRLRWLARITLGLCVGVTLTVLLVLVPSYLQDDYYEVEDSLIVMGPFLILISIVVAIGIGRSIDERRKVGPLVDDA